MGFLHLFQHLLLFFFYFYIYIILLRQFILYALQYQLTNNIRMMNPKHHKTESHGYSTKSDLSSEQTLSRDIHRFQVVKQPKAALNMNDNRCRLRRDYSHLYRRSTEESALFEKGRKRVTPSLSQDKPESREKSIRSYRNNQTYDILRPSSKAQEKISIGGKKRIYLYDQSKETSEIPKTSRKKQINYSNRETRKQEKKENFVVGILPTHKNTQKPFHDSQTHLHFGKTTNKHNEQNHKTQQQHEITRKKVCLRRNTTKLTKAQNGILGGKQNIDFNQNYFSKYSRQNMKNTKSGLLTSRY